MRWYSLEPGSGGSLGIGRSAACRRRADRPRPCCCGRPPPASAAGGRSPARGAIVPARWTLVPARRTVIAARRRTVAHAGARGPRWRCVWAGGERRGAGALVSAFLAWSSETRPAFRSLSRRFCMMCVRSIPCTAERKGRLPPLYAPHNLRSPLVSEELVSRFKRSALIARPGARPPPACTDPVDKAAKARIFSPEDPPKVVASAAEKLPPEDVADEPPRGPPHPRHGRRRGHRAAGAPHLQGQGRLRVDAPRTPRPCALRDAHLPRRPRRRQRRLPWSCWRTIATRAWR